MSVLLDVIEDKAIDRERRGLAESRPTCDYCGHPFVYGYSGGGMGSGGGYKHQHVSVCVGGRWYVVCRERCRERLVGYVQFGMGPVPRLIGRETVEEVMR